jgi:hypothetical protein
MARRALLLVALLASCAELPPAPPLRTTPPPPPPASTPPVVAAAPRAFDVGPAGEKALLEGGRLSVLVGGVSQPIEPRELHPPPGDPAIFGIMPTALLYLDDGTLLVGMGDGVVTALDGARKRRFSLGFRGAIRGLVPAGAGRFAVTTERGVMALVTSEGRLRWEKELTAERLGPAALTPEGLLLTASTRGVFALKENGELAFSHASPLVGAEGPPVTLEGPEVVAGGARFRLDAAHPPIPGLEPTFPLSFRLVAPGNFGSLVARGADEIDALGDYAVGEYNDWPGRPTQSLLRIAGGKRSWIKLPHRTKKRESFVPSGLPSYAQSTGTTRPDTSPMVSDLLVTAPDGNPWILGRRLSGELTSGEDGFTGAWIGAGLILEPQGKEVRERDDLHEAFAAHLGRGTQLGKVAASPVGKASLFCFGFGEPVCALHDGATFRLLIAPGVVTALSRVGGDDWLVTEDGGLHRRVGDVLTEVERPDARKVVAVAGTSERDVWAEPASTHGVLHFDGSAWRDVPVPAPSVGGFFARSADDVWAGSGKARWDGVRWSLVYGAPSAKRVLARGKDDVWLAGEGGLWQGTAPGPVPVRLPAPPPDAGAGQAIAEAALGPAETRFTVERATLPLKGEAPLKAAQRVSTAADGTLWFQAWDRLVEVDGAGKVTQVRHDAADSFARWAFPEGAGRGLVVTEGTLRRLDPKKPLAAEATLALRELVALDGNAKGTVWAVGGSEAELRGPQALVRTASDGAFQPVLGLPAASWSDVSAAADGGAWLAGGMSPGPAGEGILFHARGRAGGEGSTRFRAAATLLAVTALGTDEAWAVGAGGTVVHVRGGEVTRYALPGGEHLRAVFAAAPGDVWIGGDAGTLLHFDGALFHPVAHPLGSNAAITGLASGAGAIWAASPSGILRITGRP